MSVANVDASVELRVPEVVVKGVVVDKDVVDVTVGAEVAVVTDDEEVGVVPPAVSLGVVPFVVVSELAVRKLSTVPVVALLVAAKVVLEGAAEVPSLSVVLPPAVVSLLVPNVVDDPLVVGVVVVEVVGKTELESVVLPLEEVMTPPEVVLEAPPVVVVLCGRAVVPVLLMVGPLVVADEVVNVAEDVVA
ncbi:hypothetical protein AAVH_27508, partial [Aphelenchoides avenae]